LKCQNGLEICSLLSISLEHERKMELIGWNLIKYVACHWGDFVGGTGRTGWGVNVAFATFVAVWNGAFAFFWMFCRNWRSSCTVVFGFGLVTKFRTKNCFCFFFKFSLLLRDWFSLIFSYAAGYRVKN
jgi:hypothetical protein